ncbi:acyl-CoA dehydrogenase family protein [Fulvivirgaceae bacterium BMA10]|uniref:Acyl-CoA dehydrogenase family protein n=1 Tax=Splendidivirga corallicola TaxID=3051826 RepID=A0ABT8KNX4_9BACT|nr:acyl-CoA dehydrogenase family protein [Fulvivirgaceae bacterium BMA10]
MKTLQLNQTISEEALNSMLTSFKNRAAENDKDGIFVEENYAVLREYQLFSALVPEELGGMGMPFMEMCHLLRKIAQACGSTALAFSMHQHLVAAAVWKYKHKSVGEPMLRKIVEDQLVLVSTGARDWLGSNGEMKRTEGGYLVSANKHFASQSIAGDVAITSAPYLNEKGDWKVLHFSVPLKTKGVSIMNDWDVIGMRGTGSHGISFDSVFVPESAVSLERNRDEFHPVWNVVLTVAMPLIMSVYVGIAERAMELVISKAKNGLGNQEHLKYCVGKLNNRLVAAQTQWEAMYHVTNDFKFPMDQDNSTMILSLKTNVEEACKQTVSEAMESMGGQSFYKKNELERLFRDVQAASFHPLPKWNQYAFTGERILSS